MICKEISTNQRNTEQIVLKKLFTTRSNEALQIT